MLLRNDVHPEGRAAYCGLTLRAYTHPGDSEMCQGTHCRDFNSSATHS